MSRLVVMGSGETAPTMVRGAPRGVRAPRARAGRHARHAVRLPDEPRRAGHRGPVATSTRASAARSRSRSGRAASPDGAQERALAAARAGLLGVRGAGQPDVRAAASGGAPAVPAALAGVVRRGGTLVLGERGRTHPRQPSRCRSTRSTRWAPTRCGWPGSTCSASSPAWPPRSIPHYDNKEGGTHDTRFCYLGEQRLAALEALLPDEVGVLGVDEHTADGRRRAGPDHVVAGNGVVSVRRRGDTRTFAAGESLGLDELVGDAAGRPVAPSLRWPPRRPAPIRRTAGRRRAGAGPVPAGRGRPGPRRLRAGPRRRATSTAAWRRCSASRRRWPPGRPTRCRATTPTRRDGCSARWWCGSASWPSRGPATPPSGWRRSSRRCWRCGPPARESRDFATSDLVRDRLVAAAVEVRDTADGTEWSLGSGRALSHEHRASKRAPSHADTRNSDRAGRAPAVPPPAKRRSAL